jgi:hypothetical protein
MFVQLERVRISKNQDAHEPRVNGERVRPVVGMQMNSCRELIRIRLAANKQANHCLDVRREADRSGGEAERERPKMHGDCRTSQRTDFK